MKGSIIKNLLIKGLLGLALVSTLMAGSTLNVGAVELGNEQDLPVKNYIDDSDTTIKARFNGSIPFVELSNLYHLLFGGDIIINLTRQTMSRRDEITCKGKAVFTLKFSRLHPGEGGK